MSTAHGASVGRLKCISQRQIQCLHKCYEIRLSFMRRILIHFYAVRERGFSRIDRDNCPELFRLWHFKTRIPSEYFITSRYYTLCFGRNKSVHDFNWHWINYNKLPRWPAQSRVYIVRYKYSTYYCLIQCWGFRLQVKMIPITVDLIQPSM